MENLVGTQLMESLVKNRVVIKYEKDEELIPANDLGIEELIGVSHGRLLSDARGIKIFEYLFEFQEDLETFENHLTQVKMRGD